MTDENTDLDINRRTVLRTAVATGIGLTGITGLGSATARGPPKKAKKARNGPPASAGGPCFKDFECDAESDSYVKIEFVIERNSDDEIVDCYFEEETDTGLVEITSWESKADEPCEPIAVEWETDGYVVRKVTAFGGLDCDTVLDPGAGYDADQEGEAGLDNPGGNTAAISNLQFCLEEIEETQTEVMFVTDVSESMEDNFPGTPDIDGDPGDAVDGGTALEAVKSHMGGGPGSVQFLTQLTSCTADVEVGSVSCADRLNHADDLSDGDTDDGPGGLEGTQGFDADGPANLDKALGATDDPDFPQLAALFGPGTDFDPDFITDDPATGYEAERPYVEDGGSTVPEGLLRGFEGLLPAGFVTAADFGPVTGIDPSGNAGFPGTVRKLLVVFTDGRPSEADPGFGQEVSDAAAAVDIDILPIIVSDTPGQNDIDFANALATPGINPKIAFNYLELGVALNELLVEICPP